jgi:cytochrome c biogenesis protein CcdA
LAGVILFGSPCVLPLVTDNVCDIASRSQPGCADRMR